MENDDSSRTTTAVVFLITFIREISTRQKHVLLECGERGVDLESLSNGLGTLRTDIIGPEAVNERNKKMSYDIKNNIPVVL